MGRSGRASSATVASVFVLFAAADAAGAADSRYAAIRLVSRGVAAHEPIQNRDGSLEPITSPNSVIARVIVSRAADYVGAPVYFSRSRAAGSAGVVQVSSRQLPIGAIFSIALRPRLTQPLVNLLALLPGSMPSLMPVAARAMTSGFGWRQHPVLGTWRAHSGVDLAAPFGTPIVATGDGVVNTADWQGGYGLLVALDHGKGLQTRYGHMSQLNVAQGQQIHKGDVIGYVGSTGLSTGPHLHYEIRLNGQAINPAVHLQGK